MRLRLKGVKKMRLQGVKIKRLKLQGVKKHAAPAPRGQKQADHYTNIRKYYNNLETGTKKQTSIVFDL